MILKILIADILKMNVYGLFKDVLKRSEIDFSPLVVTASGTTPAHFYK